MDVLVFLLVALFLAYVLGWIMQIIGLPKIFGHMTVGFVLGLPMLRDQIITPSIDGLISTLSELGLIFILYYIGLEVDIKTIFKQSKDVIIVSVLSAVVPFVLGFVATILSGYDFKTAFVIGATMSVTAEAVSAAILKEMDMINTRIGRMILSAGIFDDVFEILILILIGTIVHPDVASSAGIDTLSLIVDLVMFGVLIYVIRFFFMPFILSLLGKKPSRGELFTASFIVVLTLAVAANSLSIGSVVGALVAGIVLKLSMKSKAQIKQKNRIEDYVEAMTFGFLEPIFFIWIGLNTNLGLIRGVPLFAIIVVTTAFVGKILGGLAAEIFLKRKWTEGFIIGVGMNARGVMEIVAAEMARKNGLITQDIYSIIVLVAVVTTVISPILFKFLLTMQKKADYQNK